VLSSQFAELSSESFGHPEAGVVFAGRSSYRGSEGFSDCLSSMRFHTAVVSVAIL